MILLDTFKVEPIFDGLINTFEGGSDTTVITTGNSGGSSGDAWSFVSGSPTYSATSPYEGSLSMRTADTTSTSYVRRDSLNEPDICVSWVQKIPQAPSADCISMYLHNGTDFVCLVQIRSTLVVRLLNEGFGVLDTGPTLDTSKIYKFTVWAKPGATTSTGEISYGIYDVTNGDTNTPVTPIFKSTTANLNTTNIDRVYVGALSGVSRSGFWYYDVVRVQTGTPHYLGRYQKWQDG